MKAALKWLRQVWPGPAARQQRVLFAYRGAFAGENRIVLTDLARYCHVGVSTLHSAPHEMAFREGKRDVFLHIASVLNLSPLDFVDIANGKGIPRDDD